MNTATVAHASAPGTRSGSLPRPFQHLSGWRSLNSRPLDPQHGQRLPRACAVWVYMLVKVLVYVGLPRHLRAVFREIVSQISPEDRRVGSVAFGPAGPAEISRPGWAFASMLMRVAH